MQIATGTVVSIEYTLTNPEGKKLDSSEGRGPLMYVHGTGGIIPGLEAELEGKKAGDEFKATIPPEKAYGVHNAGMVQVVPRSQFPANSMIMVGMQINAKGPGGRQIPVRVTKVTADEVTVDANHPLAGVPLTFDIKVVEVRIASIEEIQHRHAHGPGGVQH
jgi:FKBP-type peptidyl-prolyl cis-trans isomerase SlyD